MVKTCFTKIPALIYLNFILIFASRLGAITPLATEDAAQELGKRAAKQSVFRLKEPTKQSLLLKLSLEQIMNIATFRMNQRGLTEESRKLHHSWSSAKNRYFENESSLGSLKLGDHEPLSQWVGQTYRELESIFGETLCHIYHFDDLKILNFGLPIAFSPSGDPQSGLPWGESEYIDHFVPVAGAISYWIGDLTCEFFLRTTTSIICSISLDATRYGIETYLAPPIGRSIYSYFNPPS